MKSRRDEAKRLWLHYDEKYSLENRCKAPKTKVLTIDKPEIEEMKEIQMMKST